MCDRHSCVVYSNPIRTRLILNIFKFKPMFKQHVNLLIWTWIFVHLSMGLNSHTNRHLCANRYSCIEIRYVKLSEDMFKSWGSYAVWTCVLIWQYLKWALICLTDITWKVLLPGLSITSTFLFETTLHGWRYDDRKFNAVWRHFVWR